MPTYNFPSMSKAEPLFSTSGTNTKSRYVFIKNGSVREFESANYVSAVKRLSELTTDANGWKLIDRFPSN